MLAKSTNKTIYPKEVDIIFLTEPLCVITINKLSNVPNDIYNVFTEKSCRSALLTKGINLWCCPQYCAKDIIVCQTKINN